MNIFLTQIFLDFLEGKDFFIFSLKSIKIK